MPGENAFEQLLTGQAPEFCALIRSAKVVAATDVTALLLGESGTGKELFAAAIHQESRRAHGPFIAINCAALPGDWPNLNFSDTARAPSPAPCVNIPAASVPPMAVPCSSMK